MSETAVEKRSVPAARRPIKAWIFAALLFAVGVRLLTGRES
jgi:hypothetical protein